MLLKGPFALSVNGALHKILNTWGSRLTWTAQREHASQIVGARPAKNGISHLPALGPGAHFPLANPSP